MAVSPRQFSERGKGYHLEARLRLAVLTNVIAPYRVPVLLHLAESFDTSILTSGDEDNRGSWHGVAARLRGLVVKQAWGISLRTTARRRGGIFDYHYVHINPGYLWELIRTRPDAVISNEMGFRSITALLYGTFFRKPVWIWWGGTLHTERKRGLAKRILRRLIVRWSKFWISYGQSSTDYLLSLGVRREGIVQIQNCVDEIAFSTSTEPALQLDPHPVFLYVGQLIGRKGVDRLLDVAGVLQAEGYRFSLLLVGEGPEESQMQERVHRLSLEGVHFVPAQVPEAMPAFYRSADYVIFPTLEDVWGLVVNEALWCGVPVLCSIYAGCAEELLPPENLFDPLDLPNMAEVWRRALEGRIAEIEASRAKLKTADEVANIIETHIQATIAAGGR